MGTRGVWSLDNVENKYPQDDWVSFDNIYVDGSLSSPNFAYVGGGSNPTYDKFDLSSDTRLYGQYSWEWSPSSSGRAQYYCASTGGTSHGYWAGGGGSLPSPNWSNSVDKRTFAAGTTDAVALGNPSSNLTIGRAGHKGISAPAHGYFIGGHNGFNNANLLSAVDKIVNSTDTVSRVPSADLPSVNKRKHLLATTGNSSVGYILGGITPISSASAKIVFATDSTSQSPGSNSIIARSYTNGSSNGTACYWFGGVTMDGMSTPFSPSNSTRNFEKTTIATDTNSSVGNIVTIDTQQMAVTGNETAAYGFGFGQPSSNTSSQGHKMPYSNETFSQNPGTNLYSAKSASSAFCPRNGAITSVPTGYTESWIDGTEYYTGNDGIWFGCGFNNHPRTAAGTAVDKMNFSTETMSQSTTVSDTIQGSAGASSNTKGYFFNGLFGAPGTPTSWIHKYDYASDTMEKLSTYTGNASWRGATWDSSTATYMNLGSNYLHKLNYGNDTTSQVPSFGSIGYNGAGVSNISDGCGFIFGGYPAPGYYSTTRKFTWSTDTQTYLPSASDYPVEGASGMETLGAPSAGYVAYGSPSRSDLNKFHYSSETFEALTSFVNHGWGPPFGGGIQPWNPPNTRPYCNDNRGGTGNKTQGYFAGGVAGDEPYYAGSWIDKVTYSTDTLSTLPGMSSGWNPSDVPADLRYLRGYGAASVPESNRIVPPLPTPTPSQFGAINTYKTGGYVSPSTSNTTIDKIDMSTDTGTPAIGFAPTQRSNHGSCSNTEVGYWVGGSTGEWSPRLSSIDKFVYSTETASLLTDTLNNTDTWGIRAGGNNTTAYAGSDGKFDKISYATETVTGLPYTPRNRYSHTVWGNQTLGFMGGGHPHSVASTVDKVTYSTDAVSQLTSYLPYGNESAVCTSTSTLGYIWGGKDVPGSSYKSSTNKWVMSNDTASTIPGANLLKMQWRGCSAGTPTDALAFDGGGPPYPNVDGHKTQRLTYSTDTWAGVPLLPWNNKASIAAINPNQSGNPGLSPNII